MGAAAVASAALLAGCGAAATPLHASPRALLVAAYQHVAATSFQADVSVQLHADLSHLTPGGGLTAAQISQFQAEINLAQLSATLEYQGPKQLEMSFTLTPVLKGTWHVLVLGGSEYIEGPDGQWHLLPSAGAAGASGVSGLGSSAGGLKQELRAWAKSLRQRATVTNLGSTSVDGQSVTHLRDTLSGNVIGSALDNLWGTLASHLGSQGSKLQQALPVLQQLFQFGQETDDEYLSQSSGRLVRADSTIPVAINLTPLAALLPAGTSMPSGSASFTFSISADMSNYGKNFDLVKPASVAPGLPSGLGQLGSGTGPT